MSSLRTPPSAKEAVTSTPISPALSSTEVGLRVHSTSVGALSSSTIRNSVPTTGNEAASPTTFSFSTTGSEAASSTGVTSSVAVPLRFPAGITTSATMGEPGSAMAACVEPTEQSPRPKPRLQSAVLPAMVKDSVPSNFPSEKGDTRKVTEALF